MSVRCIRPSNEDILPLVFDSPHSGAKYPDDFKSSLPMDVLRRAEDVLVDDLFEDVPSCGATLIAADFPRSYIDPNRRDTDVDPKDFLGKWTRSFEPGPRTERGTGLIWTIMHAKTPMYDRQLSAIEIENRIDRCWSPYHQAVRQVIDAAHDSFGCVYHVNCHSMRSVGNENDAGGAVPRPDFVLSDRDGSTCDPTFIGAAYEYLRARGYSDVRLNDPMKGADLIRRYSDKDNQRHSFQIEINRRYYVDETTFLPNENYDRLKSDLSGLASELAAYVRTKI